MATPMTYRFRCSFCGYETTKDFTTKAPVVLYPVENTAHTPGPEVGRWRPALLDDRLCYGALWLEGPKENS